MKAAALAFRFRVFVFVLLYILGFSAPWKQPFGASLNTLWLAAPTLLARSGWMDLASATLVVTFFAVTNMALATALRVWGTAYMGSATVWGQALTGATIIVDGPYRYLRHPLYLGSWLLALTTSILMPAAGALLFLPAFTAFTLLLILTEERFLADHAGAAYHHYVLQAPRFFPRFAARTNTTAARPKWIQAFLAETYPVGFTLCFAVFAWRYNAHILIRCMLICFGLSLVMRALIKTAPVTQQAS